MTWEVWNTERSIESEVEKIVSKYIGCLKTDTMVDTITKEVQNYIDKVKRSSPVRYTVKIEL